MAGALSSIGGPPPAPNPTPQQSDNNAPMSAIAAPQKTGAQPMGAQPPAPPPPPPTHQQTVAALRHFGAISTEVISLLKDPDCSKSDIKSKVIDGMTNLVSDGIQTPSDAIKTLSTFPEKPFEQKQWLMQHLQQSRQAQVSVLQHHQMGYL